MIKTIRSKSEQKRQQVLEAAIELFVVQGFHNASMDQIALRAGVSKQTVYSHFSSKQELFKNAIQTRRSDYELSDASQLDDSAPPRESLLIMAQALLGLLLSDDGIRANRVCCAEAESHPEVAEVFFKEGPEHITNLLTHYLQRQVDSGRLSIANPRHGAIQFLYMVKGEAQMRALLNQKPWDSSEVSAYLNSCVEMFLKAYGVVAETC